MDNANLHDCFLYESLAIQFEQYIHNDHKIMRTFVYDFFMPFQTAIWFTNLSRIDHMDILHRYACFLCVSLIVQLLYNKSHTDHTDNAYLYIKDFSISQYLVIC